MRCSYVETNDDQDGIRWLGILGLEFPLTQSVSEFLRWASINVGKINLWPEWLLVMRKSSRWQVPNIAIDGSQRYRVRDFDIHESILDKDIDDGRILPTWQIWQFILKWDLMKLLNSPRFRGYGILLDVNHSQCFRN